MDFSWNAAIFEDLLKLNPWAAPFCAERATLIAVQRWNMNAINQGGNAETRAWMKRFFAARSAATLALLLEGGDAFDHWNKQTRALAVRVFEDARCDGSHIGTPLVNPSETGGGYSNAAVVSTYTNGQFLADFLLQAQASLRGFVLSEPLDISERVFSVGLDVQSATFRAPLMCRNANFGPFSCFEMMKCADADFSAAEFWGVASFTMARFTGKVDFTAATFHGALASTTIFDAEVCFKSAVFEADVDLSGTHFK